MHQLISSSVVGVGNLIDESQNNVGSLALEDEFRRIMKIVVKSQNWKERDKCNSKNCRICLFKAPLNGCIACEQ